MRNRVKKFKISVPSIIKTAMVFPMICGVGSFFLGWQPYASVNRVRNLDTLDIFRNLTNQSIDFVIKGVLSRLANIEIVPSNTFEYWDNRTRWLDVHPDSELEKKTNDKTSTEKEEVEEKEDLDKVYAENENNTEETNLS